MKKILFSLLTILAVGGAVAGATTAYFSDTESSSGSTFTAGTLDLKVNGGDADVSFDFSNIKPGDTGTLSYPLGNAGTIIGELKVKDVTLTGGEGDGPESETDVDTGNGSELPKHITATVKLDGIQVGNVVTLDNLAGELAKVVKVLPAETGTALLTMDWEWISSATDNDAMGDTALLGMTFVLDQNITPTTTPTEETLLFEDFENFAGFNGGVDGWITAVVDHRFEDGEWVTEDGILHYNGNGDEYKALWNHSLTGKQLVEARVNYVAYGGVTLWYQDNNNWIDVMIYPGSGTPTNLWINENINGVGHMTKLPFPCVEMYWYRLSVLADSTTGEIKIYVDDNYITTYTATTAVRSGLSGLNGGNGGAMYNDFKISQVPVGYTYTPPTHYEITAITAPHGIISAYPSRAGYLTTTVNSGGSQMYIFTPDTGYKIENLIIDGVVVPTSDVYRFANITSNHTVGAVFSPL